MTVRPVTLDEIPKLGMILKEFEKESEFVSIDSDYCAARCREFVENGRGTVLGLYDRNGEIIGGLGAILGPELSTGKMIAVEAFWFVHPEKRGRGLLLLDAFEKWARKRGADYTAMVHMVDSHPSELKTLYVSRGYKLVEMHYVKPVTS